MKDKKVKFLVERGYVIANDDSNGVTLTRGTETAFVDNFGKVTYP